MASNFPEDGNTSRADYLLFTILLLVATDKANAVYPFVALFLWRFSG